MRHTMIVTQQSERVHRFNVSVETCYTMDAGKDTKHLHNGL